MTNTWKKVVVVIALLGASSLVSARAAVTVYAEETETSSNAVVATAEAPSRAMLRPRQVTEIRSSQPMRIIRRCGLTRRAFTLAVRTRWISMCRI